MTPTERLAEIKARRETFLNMVGVTPDDLDWLIARVEELEPCEKAFDHLEQLRNETELRFIEHETDELRGYLAGLDEAIHFVTVEREEAKRKLAAHCSQAEPAPQPPGEGGVTGA